MKVQTILDQIDLGHIALPAFQRGYVWNRNQVRALMHSMYRRFPIGGLLVWVTQTESTITRGTGELSMGTVKLLLDGQQRVTSLYGIIHGQAPSFFDGDEQAFRGLYFNVEQETFSFYMPTKMKDDPLWIDVSRLMLEGIAPFIQDFYNSEAYRDKVGDYVNRLNAVVGIKDVDLHIEEITGADKTVDVVVDIFNRVNSGGTQLSKGDLALARICAGWPEARDELQSRIERWAQAGFNFKQELVLRCVNTIVTGEAMFSALSQRQTSEIKEGLQRAERRIDTLLNVLSSRLGLDHDRVLGSRYSLPLMVRLLEDQGGILEPAERERLLYWYIHTFLWGRYAGSTETILNQDLAAIQGAEDPIGNLIERLRANRGDLELRAEDFRGASRGARFYPMIYMMTRVAGACDWRTGLELRQFLLGKQSSLHLHHIFPKSKLYAHGYKQDEVNALANFTFLTAETNQYFCNRDPEDYFQEVQRICPGALESHWIPTDPELWSYDRYLDFLQVRREKLAKAANRFLDSLREARATGETFEYEDVTQRVVSDQTVDIAEEPDERELIEVNQWVQQNGLSAGELYFELLDPSTGEQQGILDLAWPEGIQHGLSNPVCLIMEVDQEVGNAAISAGYRVFYSPAELKSFIKREFFDADQINEVLPS